MPSEGERGIDAGGAGVKFWVGGATGFLGAHLVHELLALGHDVIAVSRNGGQPPGSVSPSGGSGQGALSCHAVDVLDARAVEESAQGADGAFLCTGLVSRSPTAAREMHRIHVDGTRTALDGLRAAGVPRVVVASTSGTLAVSRDPKRIDDETSCQALEFVSGFPYYRTKYFGEQAALERNGEEFQVVVVNPSLLLGPGDLRESSTVDVRRFLERAIPATPSGGVSIVDVRDAASGMRLAFEHGRAGERYLLNAANLTFAALFERLGRMTGISAPLLSMPRNVEFGQAIFGLYERAIVGLGGKPPVDAAEVLLGSHYWYCSADKAERELGFTARDLGDTLRDTVADLVEREVVLRPIGFRTSPRAPAWPGGGRTPTEPSA